MLQLDQLAGSSKGETGTFGMSWLTVDASVPGIPTHSQLVHTRTCMVNIVTAVVMHCYLLRPVPCAGNAALA